MTRFLQVRPFSHPSQWSNRLLMLGCALASWGVAVVWNPIALPGPMCCLLRRVVGLPCPMCGMTRGVALCVRGRFVEATWYNPLAVPFCLLALVLCAKWIFEIASKRSVAVVLRPAWTMSLWTALYAAVLASWIYLLIYRREDDFASTWLGQMLHLFQ
jgi:hypothetical protein